jgi:hypothetical protein
MIPSIISLLLLVLQTLVGMSLQIPVNIKYFMLRDAKTIGQEDVELRKTYKVFSDYGLFFRHIFLECALLLNIV